MSKLEQTLIALQDIRAERIAISKAVGAVSCLLVTVAYLIGMLSVPVQHVGMLLWFAIYPIVTAPMMGVAFTRIFVRSLYTLPFIVFIGIFNPIFDTVPALSVGTVTVSRGWISFVSIILRGLMSVQAIMIFLAGYGFEGFCRGFRRVGCPAFIVTQLLMVYRYLTVLLNECLNMKRARMARSYGNDKLSLKIWAQLTGQLFLRTVTRAERINRAMLARGFNGAMPEYRQEKRSLTVIDAVFFCAWISAFVVFRFTNISAILGFDRLF